MVAIEIGCLAHLTVFVGLPCLLYFEVFQNPFPEFCVFFEKMALQFFMNSFSSNFHHLSGRSTFEKGRTSKEPFLHTFLVYHVIFLLNWYVVVQVLPGNMVCFVVMLSF
jgi:hypothetical protein